MDGTGINPEGEDPVREIYGALRLGIRDYVGKNGFEKVVIGLSGGIDSALTAALAIEALSAQNVVGVSMPSAISSQSSKADANKLAENLGIEYRVVPIIDAVNAYTAMLSDEFKGTEPDVTEENIQARIRGNNEYKRQQAPIGIKITPKAFGFGRRMPIQIDIRGEG